MSVPSAAGIWLGTLQAGSTRFRLQFHLDPTSNACSLDSLDEGAAGIVCTNLSNVGSDVSFTVPAIHASFRGTVAADGKTLSGTWSQGMDLHFTLTRQQQATAVVMLKFDPALPPVQLNELKGVLDHDLAHSISSGLLSPAQHGGVVIGVSLRGQRVILAYGKGQPDGLYEIGSITKTFTGLILSQMVEQQQVRLDTPVRELLPAGTVAKPASGRELTLLDLSRQHSGLPRMPGNFKPADPKNPYADYNAKLLYECMQQQGVAVPPDASFTYSNLSVGLLGQALADRAGTTYPQLLQAQITGPLGMSETAVNLPPTLQARLVQGYSADHQPAQAWDLDALAGAGGIRSTAADMLTYLEAQLHPDHLPASSTSEGRTLPAAITQSQILHGEAGQGRHIALGWFHIDDGGGYWHNGVTGSFASHARFDPELDYAIVVLCNTASSSFTDLLGFHIAQRLEGKEAISMSNA